VAGRATVVDLREGEDGRYESTIELNGAQCRVSQRMNAYTLHGIAPGEPLSVMYDREDPSKLVIMGHAHYRVTERAWCRVEDVGA